MSQYKAYPAYKDSGVEWIGQVPEHWEVARVKRLATLRNERRSDVSTETTYIGLEDVEAGSGQYKPTNGSSRQSGDSTVGIFYEGDVLYGKLRPYLRKAIVSEMEGCCSTEFLVLRAEKTEPKWLQEWLLTPDVTHQIESGCEGAKMPRADWWHVGSIEAVYPNKNEQAQILATLKRETARIDSLIQKKTRFIELLKEKRQALITHAVTKGLDPNVKMKDSGIEWIGLVPEHWKSHRLDSAVEIVRGNSSFTKSDLLDAGEYVALQYGRTYKVDEIGCSFNSYVNREFFKDTQIAEFGDTVLISTSETLEDLGHSCFYARHDVGLIGGEQFLLKPRRQTLSKYLYYMTKAFSFHLQRYATGLKVFRFGLDDLKTIYIPNIPLAEQTAIAATLDRETARIDTLVEKTKQSITLLKERRAAFITAAVTGQIDLRGEQ